MGSSGCQLDRQRHAVDPTADLRQLVVVTLFTSRTAQPVGKKPFGVGLFSLRRGGHSQRADPDQPFARHRQGFSAGSQDRQGRAGRQGFGREGGQRRQQVLTVIENKKQSSHVESMEYRLLERLRGTLQHPQGAGYGFDNELSPHRDQVHERPAGREAPTGPGRRHHCQPSLPDAAGPDQRHQPTGLHRDVQLLHLGDAAHKGGPRPRQAGHTLNAPESTRSRPHGERRQPAPIGRARLTQQRRYVTFHRPDRYV